MIWVCEQFSRLFGSVSLALWLLLLLMAGSVHSQTTNDNSGICTGCSEDRCYKMYTPASPCDMGRCPGSSGGCDLKCGCKPDATVTWCECKMNP